MKITMLHDAPGSPDGIHVRQYDAGVEYDVPAELGETFVKYGHATPATAAPATPKAKPRASKNTGAQPEYKSA